MSSNESDDPREIVLDFHDALLRRSDLNLLSGPYWLNDEIIAFAYEYFQRRKFAGSAEEFGFISPSVVQLIKFSDKSTVEAVLGPLNLRDKSLIFFPINDN